MQIIIAMVKRTVFLRNPIALVERREVRRRRIFTQHAFRYQQIRQRKAERKNRWTSQNMLTAKSWMFQPSPPPPPQQLMLQAALSEPMFWPRKTYACVRKSIFCQSTSTLRPAQSSSLRFPHRVVQCQRLYRSVGWKIFFSSSDCLRSPLKHSRNSRSFV